MKLNIGCGLNPLSGYVNIDIIPTVRADLVADGSNILDVKPLWRGKVEEIVSYHAFEHFSHSQALRALRQWRELLQDGGKLVLELPDIYELCNMVSSGQDDDLTLAYIFGSQDRDGQNHYWGWSPSSLEREMLEADYKDIRITDPQDYHAQERPCFRIEGLK